MYHMIKLPYDYDALEPYIDRKTVRIHYTKHLKTYETNLNKLLEGHEDITKGKTLAELLSNLDEIPESIRTGVINQGGGVYNHNLYFSILGKKHKKGPTGDLLNAIIKGFGSFDRLKSEMSEGAISQFGSGYAFLSKDDKGNLFIKKTLNQNNTLHEGLTPILTIDVWEHAYYLKYKNLRGDYVKNIWNIINWKMVEDLYEGCAFI